MFKYQKKIPLHRSHHPQAQKNTQIILYYLILVQNDRIKGCCAEDGHGACQSQTKTIQEKSKYKKNIT